MTPIDEETRKRIIFDWLYREPDGLLRRLSPPDHLGKDQMRVEIGELVTEVNREIGADLDELEFRSVVHGTQSEIRRRNYSTKWPTAKIFIESATAAVEAFRATRRQKPSGKRDLLQIHADRILRGEEVSEDYVYGPGAAALLAGGYMTDAQLEAYRNGAHGARAALYGPTEADDWRREATERHQIAMNAANLQIEKRRADEQPLFSQPEETEQ